MMIAMTMMIMDVEGEKSGRTLSSQKKKTGIGGESGDVEENKRNGLNERRITH